MKGKEKTTNNRQKNKHC